MKTYTVNTIPSVAQIRSVKKARVAASLFAGCGGSSTGLQLAGFDVRYASEFVPTAVKTYTANWPKTHVDTRDIRTVDPRDVLRACRVKRGELDLLDGSPPCVLYSAAARHARLKKNDDDVKPYSEGIKQRVDDLFDEFIRVLRGVRPKAFTAENVPGLAMEANSDQLAYILTAMRASGYDVTAQILDASWLGVPQARRRLVFVGVRRDLRAPEPVIRPLARQSLTTDVIPSAHRIHYGGRGYASAHAPYPTITAIGHRLDEQSVLSTGGFVETKSGDRRKLTIPEVARLFGFPRDYQFVGSFAKQWERLGRSHAPLQVYYVASAVRAALDEAGA